MGFQDLPEGPVYRLPHQLGESLMSLVNWEKSFSALQKFPLNFWLPHTAAEGHTG